MRLIRPTEPIVSTPVGNTLHDVIPRQARLPVTVRLGGCSSTTKRPDIAEHLYRLKNWGSAQDAIPIIPTAAEFLQQNLSAFDILVPVPPSKTRSLQPVLYLAEGIAKTLSKPYCPCVTTTRQTAQLKDISDPEQRKAHMEGLYAVDAAQTAGKRILLFDDLFRSGTTLNAITELLLTTGKATDVVVLTITRTRVNQ